MRIDIDSETEQKLDKIRRENWHISGKGHADTVRFLARYYYDHKELLKILDNRLEKIPEQIREGFLEALRRGLTSLFTGKSDDKQPENAGRRS